LYLKKQNASLGIQALQWLKLRDLQCNSSNNYIKLELGTSYILNAILLKYQVGREGTERKPLIS
jgi:hypothetical protein